MADPFEVRMRFTTLLTHLSASTTALTKTAHYALKHRDMDEDLHSCILENLERGHNMNNRANIMYFLEQHADINMKDGGHAAYVDMVRRDIMRVVEAVAQSGANVKVVRRVVGGLKERGVLEEGVAGEVENVLKEREEKMGRLLGDEKEGEDAEREGEIAGDKEMLDAPAPPAAETVVVVEGQSQSHKVTPKGGVGSGHGVGKTNGVSKVDKRAIEQRIEEDRERNKRLRESMWAVNGDDDQEFEKMWDDGSDLGEDDFVIAAEEAEERKQFARYHQAMLET